MPPLFFTSHIDVVVSKHIGFLIVSTVHLTCMTRESLLLLSVVEPAIMFVPELEAAGSTPHKHHN